MRQIQSSNPAFNSKAFKEATKSSTADGAMTIAGTVNKTILLTLLVLASASYTWLNPSTTLMWVGIIGGLIAALVTSFKPNLSPISAPVYALLEGMALGGISLYISQSFGGGSIVFQAIASTIGVFFAMLFLYRTGIIKVNKKLRSGIMAATGGIALMYIINMVMGFFGGSFLSLQNTSWMMIGINLVIVGVAAFNLLLDFDFIERGAKSGAPKYMEWFGAFGLMVTLVWLYLELLKLLARLQSRD
jgi:uncharacterized YccA/Bax inhibitor family protein